MNSFDYKKLTWPLFLFMVLLQLYVPAKMVWDSETVLTAGQAYKFKTAPIDPSDPFRGKYIVLQYDRIGTQFLGSTANFSRGEEVYVGLTTNQDGFAKIASVSTERPNKNIDFLQVKINRVQQDKLTVSYPFNRYYMEESKAYDAELAHRESLRNGTAKTYALVYVKNGTGILKDVLIDGVSIKKLVEKK